MKPNYKIENIDMSFGLKASSILVGNYPERNFVTNWVLPNITNIDEYKIGKWNVKYKNQ